MTTTTDTTAFLVDDFDDFELELDELSPEECERLELEELEREELERTFAADYAERPQASSGDPQTDQELWRYIKYKAGGIRRSPDYWDTRLTWRENRAAFRYLDRGWKLGRGMDELAQEIGNLWPWFGINTDEDLWVWMQRTRRC